MSFLNKIKGFSFSKSIFEETKMDISNDIKSIEKKISDEVGGTEDESIIDGILDDITDEMLNRASEEADIQDALKLFSDPAKIDYFFKYRDIKSNKIKNIQEELEKTSTNITSDNEKLRDKSNIDFRKQASDLNLELDRLRKLIEVYSINSNLDIESEGIKEKTKELSDTPESLSSAIDVYRKIAIDIVNKLRKKDDDELLIDQTEDTLEKSGMTIINININGEDTTPEKEIKKIKDEDEGKKPKETIEQRQFTKEILKKLQNAYLPESTDENITKPGDFFSIINDIKTSEYSQKLYDLVERNSISFGENNEFLNTENPDVKYQLSYLELIRLFIDSMINEYIKEARENKKWKNSIEKIYLDKQVYIKNKNLSRKINMSDFAGLKIKREIHIPLYKTVNIPITDEDIIANSSISKFRKAMKNLSGIMGWQQSYVDQGRATANSRQNKAVLQGITQLVRGTAGVIGGEKAKKKANLTMKKVGNALGTEIKEDMLMPMSSDGMPGTPFDVPQSVPGEMDTLAKLGPGGTGKNPKKKKKKSKRFSAHPDKKKSKNSRVLSFGDFINR